MSTLSSANVTDVNLVLKERTRVRLCLNMLIFTHNLGNWLMTFSRSSVQSSRSQSTFARKYTSLFVVENHLPGLVRISFGIVFLVLVFNYC